MTWKELILMILADLIMTYSGCKIDTIYIWNALMCILHQLFEIGKRSK